MKTIHFLWLTTSVLPVLSGLIIGVESTLHKVTAKRNMPVGIYQEVILEREISEPIWGDPNGTGMQPRSSNKRPLSPPPSVSFPRSSRSSPDVPSCVKILTSQLVVPEMAPLTLRPSTSHFVYTLRALVAISYFALTILFYIRAPSPSGLFFPSQSNSESKYPSVGVFGDAMVAMLGSSEEPFTIFVPSHAAFRNASVMFRNGEGGEGWEGVNFSDTNSATYAVMSHLLSFSAVPKSILSKHVPFGKEVVYEALSGFLISLTRVRGKGLLVNNITCAKTDLRRGRLVIHVLNGVLMDSEFAQSMGQDAILLADDDDIKPDWEEEEQEENEDHA